MNTPHRNARLSGCSRERVADNQTLLGNPIATGATPGDVMVDRRGFRPGP